MLPPTVSPCPCPLLSLPHCPLCSYRIFISNLLITFCAFFLSGAMWSFTLLESLTQSTGHVVSPCESYLCMAAFWLMVFDAFYHIVQNPDFCLFPYISVFFLPPHFHVILSSCQVLQLFRLLFFFNVFPIIMRSLRSFPSVLSMSQRCRTQHQDIHAMYVSLMMWIILLVALGNRLSYIES